MGSSGAMSDRASESVLADRVRSLVGEWVGAAPSLRERFASDFPPAFTWAVTCSPEAEVDQIALATMDLHLWFLYLDDYAGEDYDELFGRLLDLLRDEPSTAARGQAGVGSVMHSFSEHMARLTRYGTSMSRYRAERRKALKAYGSRNRRRATGWEPSFQELLSLREVTTLFRLWYTLWEILGGFQISDQEYESEEFDGAIRATGRWHVYVNDLHSISRDERDNMPNLVRCLERDRAWSRDEAIAHLRRGCDELEAEVRRARLESKRQNAGRRSWRAAFEFLVLTIDGGKELYRRKLERYRAPDGTPGQA